MVATAVIPRSLYRAEQVRELDRAAIAHEPTGGTQLMERAGASAYESLRRHWPNARRISVVCGIGNNAGDGYVLSRHAHESGLAVTVAQLGDASRLKGEAADAWQKMQAAGQSATRFSPASLDETDVIVDAIFGTGLSREVQGEWRACIEAIKRSAKPVLAIDIPSGLDSDTGAAHGVFVEACNTVTFVGLKQGMFTGLGPAACGTIEFDDLGISPSVYERTSVESRLVSLASMTGSLSPRSREAHKGHFGHVLIVGGEHGFAGAAALAGEAAARVGAGLVSIATRERNVAPIVARRAELMCHAVETASEVDDLAARASVVAIGPGLGQSVWSRTLLSKALAAGKPLVVDADALNLIAEAPCRRDDWVLTPHPGEAARLLECPTAQVQADRFSAARKLVAQYAGICVLKGAGTLIAEAGESVAVCRGGNPGMATGGMGDVLTGVIAGLIAQGLGLREAAGLGVCLHAEAGDAAAREGERGTLASDLMPHLRRLVNPSP